MTKIAKENISQWYDDYSTRQKIEGINTRHKKIMYWLLKAGLTKNSKILEIGCGVGTQTQLIAEFLDSDGFILANDISNKSVEIARFNLKEYANIKFTVGDIINTKIDDQFDIILLPDVLEHIPIKDHSSLFKKLRSLVKDTGNILIHIPNPYYLNWCHENTPELLQIIDQPIYTGVLIRNIEPANLYIDFLETYSIWFDNNDYQIINLKPDVPKQYIHIIKTQSSQSFKSRLKNKLIRIIQSI